MWLATIYTTVSPTSVRVTDIHTFLAGQKRYLHLLRLIVINLTSWRSGGGGCASPRERRIKILKLTTFHYRGKRFSLIDMVRGSSNKKPTPTSLTPDSARPRLRHCSSHRVLG